MGSQADPKWLSEDHVVGENIQRDSIDMVYEVQGHHTIYTS